MMVRLFLLSLAIVILGAGSLTRPVVASFASAATGSISIVEISGDTADMQLARRLTLQLQHDADRRVFEQLLRSKKVLAEASVVSQSDGFRFDLQGVRVVGIAHDVIYPGYSVTVRFAESHITCGPPTCRKR